MRLTDLDPHWLQLEDRRVGFVFRSPTKPQEWWQSCFFEAFPVFGSGAADASEATDWVSRRSQYGIMKANGIADLTDLDKVQACEKTCAWTCTPPADEATFENISVQPSLDGSKGGLWHGHITNGEIVGGLP